MQDFAIKTVVLEWCPREGAVYVREVRRGEDREKLAPVHEENVLVWVVVNEGFDMNQRAVGFTGLMASKGVVKGSVDDGGWKMLRDRLWLICLQLGFEADKGADIGFLVGKLERLAVRDVVGQVDREEKALGRVGQRLWGMLQRVGVVTEDGEDVWSLLDKVGDFVEERGSFS